MGLGTTGGFKLQLEDRGSLGYEQMDAAVKAFMAKASQAPELAGMFTSWQINVPQLYADIDRTKARQLGVPVTDVFDTMQIYLGVAVRQRLQQVRPHLHRARAGGCARSARAPKTSACSRCARPRGEMVPLSALMKVQHGRRSRSARCATTASCRPTSTAARRRATRRARRRTRSSASPPRRCPRASAYEWTDLTYQEILAGNSAVLDLPDRDPAGVPRAGRALREPDAAAGDHPDRADGPPRRADRRVAQRRRQQRVHADRARWCWSGCRRRTRS